jgi:hypothetical protein
MPASQPSPLPPPSSRPGAGSCRGSSLSRVCAERSGGTRPPGAPLTGGFRGGRIARLGEDGPAARGGAVSRVRHGGDQLTAGAGVRRCGGETPASRALRGGTLDCPARPSVTLRSCPELAQGRPARRAEGVPLEPSRKAASLGRAQRRATLRHMAHRAPGARRRGPSRGHARSMAARLQLIGGIGSRRSEAPLKGCQRGCHLGRASGRRCRLRRRPCLSWDLGAGCQPASRGWLAIIAPEVGTVDGSLYERVGGTDGIRAATLAFEDRAAKDARINQKFARTDLDRLTKEFVDQVCQATGGPCTYTGRNMTETHANRG